MATLTAAQMNDSAYLANMLNKLAAQKTDALRQNEMTTQQNMRRLREANALNGINGGYEESNYARLLAGQNAARANISSTYDPEITQYQSYLDKLNALQAARAAGGGYSERKPPASQSVPSVGSGYYASLPSYVYEAMFGVQSPYVTSTAGGKATYDSRDNKSSVYNTTGMTDKRLGSLTGKTYVAGKRY